VPFLRPRYNGRGGLPDICTERFMSTTVDLTEQELAELQAFTNEVEPTAAIRAAMSEYLRLVRRRQLKALSGHVEMEDNWQAREAAELRNSDGDARPGAH
jgi:hypothetical protein